VLLRLLAEFVGGQMISLVVGYGRSGVGVGRKVVEFCCSIVGALWHSVLRSGCCSLDVVGVLREVLVVVQVFFRNIVHRYLAGSYLRHVRILGVLHSLYDTGFECVSFL
jgi:hypothetical protein